MKYFGCDRWQQGSFLWSVTLLERRVKIICRLLSKRSVVLIYNSLDVAMVGGQEQRRQHIALQSCAVLYVILSECKRVALRFGVSILKQR
jgi:hypothetical protein